MRKLFSVFGIAALLLAACDNESVPVYNEHFGKILKISDVATEVTDESAEELKAIAGEGFRLIEYGLDGTILRQSKWSKPGDVWTSDQELPVVNASTVAAVYPEGEDVGEYVNFSAGINNMTAFETVDMSKTNKVAVNFKHQMCQVSANFKNESGEVINYGTENGQVQKVTLTQPSDMSYSLFHNKVEKIGEDADYELSSDNLNYVVPGGETYKFKVEYKNKEGKTVYLTGIPSNKFERNKKYDINFTIKDGDAALAIELDVSVESWQSESYECELDEDDLPTLEIPKGAIKEGTIAPKGYYVVFMINDVKYALEEDKYFSQEGLTPVGILFSSGKRQVVLAPTECGKAMWQWSVSYNSWEDAEIIDGVNTFREPRDANRDFEGRKNTEALLAWATSGEGRSTSAAKKATEYEYGGITDWYLPAGGEMALFMSFRFRINYLISKLDGFDELMWSQSDGQGYWSSTQTNNKFAHGWYHYGGYLNGFGKNSLMVVRPVTNF